MFAGAAREAVFSREDIISKINERFVPVAIKAALMNNPPGGVEGAYLREIRRSKIAPQGICALNSDGKVLAWSLMFDEKKSVPEFLDHVLARYRRSPDASRSVETERFMRFPSTQHATSRDSRAELPDVVAHRPGEPCPATPPKPRGTIVARVWGRAVDAKGRLATNCHQQDEYIEDVFDIPPDLQLAIATKVREIRDANKVRGLLPTEFARLVASYAYLGQLDVRPVRSPVPNHETEERELEFWAKPLESKNGELRVALLGYADVLCTRRASRRGPVTAGFLHEVKLRWKGELTLRGDRVVDLAIHATGNEKLRWNARAGSETESTQDVRSLPAGRVLKVDTAVRYGILAAMK